MDRATASVVIAAHDEEGVIGRCLDSLAAQPGIAEVEVVVVANGCSDSTARRASDYGARLPRLRVVELDEASKVAALNRGDREVTAFPRLYLDGDVELGAATLPDLVHQLARRETPAVASPSLEFDLTGASWTVRRFYEAFALLPYMTQGLVGLGLYALNAGGRQRFAEFPALVADDLFVQRLFAPEERLATRGSFLVRTPRTARDLVRVRARVARGNAELADQAATGPGSGVDAGPTTRATLLALVGAALKRPRAMPAVAVYVVITALARALARRRRGAALWERDHSSREASRGARRQEST